MTLDQIHGVLIDAFRKGVNEVRHNPDFTIAVKEFNEASQRHELDILIRSRHASREFLENYDPGGEPDLEEHVILGAIYHLVQLRRLAFRIRDMRKAKAEDPVEYGKQTALAQLFGN